MSLKRIRRRLFARAGDRSGRPSTADLDVFRIAHAVASGGRACIRTAPDGRWAFGRLRVVDKNRLAAADVTLVRGPPGLFLFERWLFSACR